MKQRKLSVVLKAAGTGRSRWKRRERIETLFGNLQEICDIVAPAGNGGRGLKLRSVGAHIAEGRRRSRWKRRERIETGPTAERGAALWASLPLETAGKDWLDETRVNISAAS